MANQEIKWKQKDPQGLEAIRTRKKCFYREGVEKKLPLKLQSVYWPGTGSLMSGITLKLDLVDLPLNPKLLISMINGLRYSGKHSLESNCPAFTNNWTQQLKQYMVSFRKLNKRYQINQEYWVKCIKECTVNNCKNWKYFQGIFNIEIAIINTDQILIHSK